MTTGQLIQQARKKAELSQKQLGEKLGLSASMIGQWENDLRNPKYDTIRRIAAALDVEWTELVPEEEQGQQVVDHIREGLKSTGPLKKISMEEAYRLGILNITFKSEEDRIAYFYGKLNTDGRLIASKCFYRHLDKDSVGEVADYIEKLSEVPQYQRTDAPETPPLPGESPDTALPSNNPETPPESE